MRKLILTILGAALLAACSTAPTPVPAEAQQVEVDQIEIVLSPLDRCYVGAEVSDDSVVFTAEGLCSPHQVIPFKLVNEDGHVHFDGGVYRGNETGWIPRSGLYQILHWRNGVVGTVDVP